MSCINKNNLEYQTLKKMSGISDFSLESTVQYYLDNFNRYPELDELPNVDSTKFLKESLDVKNEDSIQYASIDTILDYTQSLDIKSANIKLNNKFKDLEIKVNPIVENAIIEIKKRPSQFKVNGEEFEVNTEKDSGKSRAVIQQALNKFRNLYGINIISINSDELRTKKWKNIVDDAKTTNAFVYNGDIYINTDIANIDAPVHELMHLFLGAMRYTNPEVYFSLVEKVKDLPNLQDLAKTYRNRTESDLLEELFVTEFSKYLTGQKTLFSTLPQSDLNFIMYNVTRNLDTLLMGNYSVRGLDTHGLCDLSIQELAEKVESSIVNPRYVDIMDKAALHRQVSNAKSDLLRKGKLTQICE